jgi:tetratricopeptide (TPR) repeat protein
MTDARMDPLGAELAFVEGRTLLESDSYAEAVPHLQQAVDSRPDQAAYHAWLGWTLWRARGAAARDEARDRLEHALALDPDSTEAHTLMGSFLSAIEEPEGARPHLERTLMLRPDQPEAADQLVVIYLRAGEPDLAEKLYRRLIGALGDREPGMRARWWEQLARLYKGPLADPAAAARAVESAAQIVPG